MPERFPRTAAAGLVVLLLAGAAGAHSVRIFAAADGDTIRGEAYFVGGGRPRNAKIDVLAPGGARLGEVRTDDEGRFTFRATRRCGHTFVLETADGHRAEYTVGADELPGGLPGTTGTAAATRPASAGAAPGTAPAAPTAAPPASLRAMIAQVVRKELEAHERRIRLRDVIAGIGYIFGLAGVVVLVRRRDGRSRAQPPRSPR